MTLTLQRGALHFTRALYERHFAPLSGVVLLRHENDLLVMPVRLAGAGGYLMKIRNAAGDRVVDAAELFRENGITDDATARELTASWQEERGALVIRAFFA